jgi:threonine dehydrogenase-like Zn-dependent dehydrogenase
MRGTVLYGPRDTRSEDLPEPKITQPTDAILRPLDQVAEGYRAMDERRAIKALLQP